MPAAVKTFYIEVHRHGRLPAGYSLPTLLNMIPELTGLTYPLVHFHHLHVRSEQGTVDLFEVINPTQSPLGDVYYCSVGDLLSPTQHLSYMWRLLESRHDQIGGIPLDLYTGELGVQTGLLGCDTDHYLTLFTEYIDHQIH